MSNALGDRIAVHLAGTGRALTAREIAAELHVRLSDVIATLKSDVRFYPWPHKRKKLYGVTVGGPIAVGFYGAGPSSLSAADVIAKHRMTVLGELGRP